MKHLYNSYLPHTPFGGKPQEQEYELLPEFDILNSEYAQEFFNETPAYENEYERAATRQLPSSINLYDTNLNAPCFAGNFNFMFDGVANKALATFNTDVLFKAGVPDPEKPNIWARLKEAAAYWNNAAALEIKDKNGNYSRQVSLGFELKPVTNPKYSNKRTSVHPDGSKAIIFMDKDREVVSLEMHLFASSTPLEIAHELGHIWGLKDEYKDSGKIGWITMKISPCHIGTGSPFLNDINAIMNGGNEFRTRYFTHFGRAILNSFWSMPDYIIPVVQNGRVVARTIQGRIRLLKRTVTGGTPGGFGALNPQFGLIQVARR
jgi:hypothetical protein